MISFSLIFTMLVAFVSASRNQIVEISNTLSFTRNNSGKIETKNFPLYNFKFIVNVSLNTKEFKNILTFFNHFHQFSNFSSKIFIHLF